RRRSPSSFPSLPPASPRSGALPTPGRRIHGWWTISRCPRRVNGPSPSPSLSPISISCAWKARSPCGRDHPRRPSPSRLSGFVGAANVASLARVLLARVELRESPSVRSLTFRRPDDWHVHFRDGAVLRTVVPYTAASFARAIVMPNLVPPVTTTAMAAAYRE